MRGAAISIRNRVLVLLVSLLVFLSAAAVVSLALRARAGPWPAHEVHQKLAQRGVVWAARAATSEKGHAQTSPAGLRQRGRRRTNEAGLDAPEPGSARAHLSLRPAVATSRRVGPPASLRRPV